MAEQARLILDVMGADLGCAEMLRGAAAFAAGDYGQRCRIVLVSAEPDKTREQARRELEPVLHASGGNYEIVAAEALPPFNGDTSPVDVYRKYPQCSIRLAMEAAQAAPERSAVVSPGTTGLVMTAATFILGRLPGIARPPIVTPMPTRSGDMIFLDGGSNVDCKPEHLHQFAVLAHAYVKAMKGIAHPTVALLSNGSEEYKGNAQVKEAWELLAADRQLNFAGYTEGHTMLSGELDIMVCDGFLGNIVLKLAEGVAEYFVDFLKAEMKQRPLAGLAAKTLQRPVWDALKKRTDYAQFGGAPLLGLKGNVVICHGRSTATAIANALAVGRRMVDSGAATAVAELLDGYEWHKP